MKDINYALINNMIRRYSHSSHQEGIPGAFSQLISSITLSELMGHISVLSIINKNLDKGRQLYSDRMSYHNLTTP